MVGGAQQHRPRARHAVHDGADGRARSFVARVHVRLQDGDRRDEEASRRGLHARLAAGDRDGRGDEAVGGRDVAVAGHPGAMSATSPTPEETREGQTFSGTTRLSTYASFVKLPHTVFALPFALVGVIIASYQHPVTWPMLGWVVLAFTAMGFNRIVDRDYDARNPRTRMRELPRGAMSVREAWASVAIASVVFVAAAG